MYIKLPRVTNIETIKSCEISLLYGKCADYDFYGKICR